ncbi:hypothetical protein L195_g059079, partial [Trifolium pratense]
VEPAKLSLDLAKMTPEIKAHTRSSICPQCSKSSQNG